MADSCGADIQANALVTTLLQGKSFNIPPVDLTLPQFQIPDLDNGVITNPLTISDLTTKSIDGTGSFDVIMSSVYAHLKGEFEKQRITGQEYTKAYIELTTASLSGAIQFLLGRDQAYWQAILVRNQAMLAAAQIVKTRVELETAKVMLNVSRIQALNTEAEYALIKMRVATEDANYCGVLRDNEIKTYNLTVMLPTQKTLLDEQIEVQRGQTLNNRRDGVVIVGSIGKQKDLYTQQITSYQRDGEVKAAKMFVDAWITQKTIDEGLLPPSGFTNVSLDTILSKLKINNGLT
jgi:hypothetical protein